MATMNSFGNHVLAANATFNGGTMNIGSDAVDNAINIGTAANAGRTVTVGNVTGASAVNVNTGTAGTTYTTTNGIFTLNTGTGTISIGTDAAAKTINIGTTTTTSTLAEKCGTGGYTLASATGTLIKATSTGYVTKPLTCAFSAYNSTQRSNFTGDGTYSTVIFDTVVYDQASNYNNGTYTFTAPVTGKYSFSMGLFLTGLTALHTVVAANIITTAYVYSCIQMTGATTRTADTYLLTNGTIMASMTAGDTATVAVAVYNGTKVVNILGAAGFYTYFMGRLVC
jgi:C1q domain